MTSPSEPQAAAGIQRLISNGPSVAGTDLPSVKEADESESDGFRVQASFQEMEMDPEGNSG